MIVRGLAAKHCEQAGGSVLEHVLLALEDARQALAHPISDEANALPTKGRFATAGRQAGREG
ncbi:hypothetical protein D3C73_1368640 [compost metagenome]